MIVKLTHFGEEFETELATLRPASTGLDHACRLTKKLAVGSWSSHRHTTAII